MKTPLNLSVMSLLAAAMGYGTHDPVRNLNSKRGGGSSYRRSHNTPNRMAWKKIFGGLAVPSIEDSRFS